MMGKLGTALCKRGTEKKRKRRRLPSTAAWVAAGTEFRALNQVLEKVITLNYLGRMMSLNDSNWTVFSRNLQRVHRKRVRLSPML